MCATVAVYSGRYNDHGWAVYDTQASRHCRLLYTAYWLSDEEAFWTAVSAWAIFQPRAAKPRQEPGKVYYPNEFSPTVEEYCDYLHCLDQQPDFSSQSPYRQHSMRLFSQAIIQYSPAR
jgi:hypothetical protein